jgi:hypothetical protein
MPVRDELVQAFQSPPELKLIKIHAAFSFGNMSGMTGD